MGYGPVPAVEKLLAKTGVKNARIEGLWENAPTQANDLTQVRWQ